MQKTQRVLETRTIRLIDNELNYRSHKARLAQISKSTGPQLKSQKTMNEHTLKLLNSERDRQRKQAIKTKEIQKDNDRILDRLMRINFRHEKKKPTAVSPAKSPEPAKILFDNGKIKSLNFVSRKNDLMKILDENIRLTGRIAFKESGLAKEKFERHFQQSREYSTRIRKIKVNPDNTFEVGHGGIKLSKDLRMSNPIPHLPPLPSLYLLHPNSKPPSSRSSSVPKLRSIDLDRVSHSISQLSQKQYSIASSYREHKPSMSLREDYSGRKDMSGRKVTRSHSNMGIMINSPSRTMKEHDLAEFVELPDQEQSKEEVEVSKGEEKGHSEEKEGGILKKLTGKVGFSEKQGEGLEGKGVNSLIKEESQTLEESKRGSYADSMYKAGEELKET